MYLLSCSEVLLYIKKLSYLQQKIYEIVDFSKCIRNHFKLQFETFVIVAEHLERNKTLSMEYDAETKISLSEILSVNKIFIFEHSTFLISYLRAI